MVSVFSHRWDTAGWLPRKGCNNHRQLLHTSLGQSEAGNGLQQHGKLSKEVLFLQDNASSHMAAIIQWKLADLHFEVPTHPAHSSDLAATDYHLFPNFKNIWTGWNFWSMRIPCLLQATSLQPNFQHSIWMIYRSCSSEVRSVMNSGEVCWMKYSCQTAHCCYYKAKDLSAMHHISCTNTVHG
jgi:hypothetical protein